MLLLAALAIAVSTPPTPALSSSGPVVQARATVRIVSGVRIHLDGQSNGEVPAMRDALVRTDGTTQPARLIEFE
jgi:hypothetical protein